MCTLSSKRWGTKTLIPSTGCRPGAENLDQPFAMAARFPLPCPYQETRQPCLTQECQPWVIASYSQPQRILIKFFLNRPTPVTRPSLHSSAIGLESLKAPQSLLSAKRFH